MAPLQGYRFEAARVSVGQTEPASSMDKYESAQRAAAGSRRFHTMAKPAGSTCNLDCKYCFYLSKETLSGGPGTGVMSDATLEAFVRQYIEGNTGPEVVFTWQGGEPMLRGLPFYRRVVELQKQYAKPGQRIENDLQTNGVLIDEEWAAFLKQNRFLVGLSIDGPRDVHDAYRINKGGAPTFDKVMAAANLLRKARVPFNTLTCVHRLNGRRPLDVYRFLRNELDSRTIQFSPVVQIREFETKSIGALPAARMPVLGSAEAKPGHADSIVTDWSVDPDDYGYFLSRVFDEWLRKDVGRVFVNQIETLISQHAGLGSQMCIYGEYCGKAVAIEHDGSVYSCDHFVYPEYKIGSTADGSLADLVFSNQQIRFGFAKSDNLPQFCRNCAFLSDCWGECPRNRILRTPDGEPGLNYLCAGLRKFYAHAMSDVERLAKAVRTRTPFPAR